MVVKRVNIKNNFIYYKVVLSAIAYNVWRPCAGRISQTFAANQTEVHREDKDFEANAPQMSVRGAGLLKKQRLPTQGSVRLAQDRC
jgi:hypothetical protein